MLEGGEDPRFIARRMVILASEDVGNADPQALLVATAAAQAVDRVGLPECALNLAQAAVYLALAPKSNASYKGLGAARAHVREHGAKPPPDYLRDAHYPGAASSAAARATSTPTTSRAASPTSRCSRRRSRASASTSRPTAGSSESSASCSSASAAGRRPGATRGSGRGSRRR